MRWMHRVRLYPKTSQIERLEFMLDITRQTYNALLEERRYAWIARRIRVTSKMQYAEMTALRAEDRRFAAVYRECQDAMLHRLDLAFASFFRRVKNGEAPGYPRFKPRACWKQLEFPHGDRALRLDGNQTRVRIPGVGSVRLRKGQAIPPYGRAFVLEKNGRWWSVFECRRDAQALPLTRKVVGIDRGVHVLAATSEGVLIRNGQHGERLRRVVSSHQRILDAATVKDVKGRCLNRRDPVRRAAALRLARAKEREANARLDGLHKAALTLVRSADVIALEELDVRSMTRSAKGTVEQPGRNVAAKSGLNRAMLDAGFGKFAALIREKAAWAIREVVSVDARYSSQTCGRCLRVDPKSRLRRRFCCVGCGWCCHADVAAALEIKRRAEEQRKSGLARARTPLTPQLDAA